MANSEIRVSQVNSVATNVATYSFSESGDTKQLQRIVLNDSAGVEITLPFSNSTVTLANNTVLLGNNSVVISGNVTSLDNGPAWTTSWGLSNLPFFSADASGAAANVTGAPTSGQKIVVDDLIFSVDTTMSVIFKCETSGANVLGPIYCTGNSGPIQITTRGHGPKLQTVDKKLQVQASAAGNVMVLVGYHSET